MGEMEPMESTLPTAGYRPPNAANITDEELQPSTLPLHMKDVYHKMIREAVANHVDSFDFAIGDGLHLISEEMEPAIVRGPKSPGGESSFIALRVHSLSIQKPRMNLSANAATGMMRPVLPHECRLTQTSYQGELHGAFTIVVDNQRAIEIESQRIARIPIMVGSSACNLRGKTREQLVRLNEEEFETGGYFISNGTEKVIRIIVVPRANHPVSVSRARNSLRGPLFSDISLSYRSMRRDWSASTMHFHLLRNGAVRGRISCRLQEYFIPVGVLLRAFLPAGTTDREIFELIVGGDSNNSALCKAGLAIVQELSERYVHLKKRDTEPGFKKNVSRTAVTAYLGKMFRRIIALDDPDISNLEAGTAFLRRFVLVHLSAGPFESRNDALDRSKADLIVQLIRKLVATSDGKVEVDNPDATSHQSALTPGMLYLNLLKNRIEAMLELITLRIRKDGQRHSGVTDLSASSLQVLIRESIAKTLKMDPIGTHLSYLIGTGNLRSNVHLDLSSQSGFTILAERINFFRFLSHFRAIHRGSFFAAIRSTKVRKLLPEAWGFVCPVHTPDGDPCGILNHLAAQAVITHRTIADRKDVMDLFSDLNIIPSPALCTVFCKSVTDALPVTVDGRVLGFVKSESAQDLADQIRYMKVKDAVESLKGMTEVVFVPPSDQKAGFMPGIFVYTGAGRLMRPVKWLRMSTKKVDKGAVVEGTDEWIGSLEQVFLRVRPALQSTKSSLNKVNHEGATHAEVDSVAFLSILAQLSPFPDMNQGPRNMFQCQMAKQTMGTPSHVMKSRLEAKMYKHTYPQVPIARNFCMHDPLGADLYPSGVNAVVAVVSYSGNDMEDALILNKASIERGFAHGTVYTTDKVNLDALPDGQDLIFIPTDITKPKYDAMDVDGLPSVGRRVRERSILYQPGPPGERESVEQRDSISHKSVEEGVIDSVIVYDSTVYRSSRKPRGVGIREANIRLRFSRKPAVGDKFASRAGQKGTMSAAWPAEDMPFSETGMTPDILFNPNGFPSRMTIGMMVELMSGKSGALHGSFNDSTPFQFDEDKTAVDFFADQLVKAGYEYSGNETLYSGYTGEPLEVSIFTGIVYYQRLRHMVSDKFQVRSTGNVNPLFRQPVKGRKRGGAIRFGEMERDSLLAHGASFLLRDRLAIASDIHVLHACHQCGSILTPIARKTGNDVTCRHCEVHESKGLIRRIVLPYAFKYLVNELAAMNIRTVLQLKEVA